MDGPAACRRCGVEVPADAAFCQKCGAKMGWDDGHDKLVAEVAELRAQVADLQSVVDSNAEVQEQIAEIVNSSNVYHTDFFARSLAIWGHALVWGIAASFIVGLFTALLGWGM